MDPIINHNKYLSMNSISKTIGLCSLLFLLTGCQTKSTQIETTLLDSVQEVPSTAAVKETLIKRGFKIIDYVDKTSGDTILMQQYFMAILRPVDNPSLSEKELDSLTQLHL